MYTKGTVAHKEDVPKKTIDHGQMEDWLNRIWPKVEIVGKYLKFLILSINILGQEDYMEWIKIWGRVRDSQ